MCPQHSKSSHRVRHQNNKETHEQKGWRLKREGKYKEAIQEFDLAIKSKNSYKRDIAIIGKGECLIELGEYQKAIQSFEYAKNINKNHPWIYHGIGRAYHGQQKYDRALIYYNKSIELYRRGVTAWYWKGKALLEIDKYADAEAALSTALRHAIERESKQYLVPKIEHDLKTAREKNKPLSESSQIVINGDNNSPINIDGIQSTDDAVINRATIDNSSTENTTIIQQTKNKLSRLFHKNSRVCADCGNKLDEDAVYCKHCGKKIE